MLPRPPVLPDHGGREWANRDEGTILSQMWHKEKPLFRCSSSHLARFCNGTFVGFAIGHFSPCKLPALRKEPTRKGLQISEQSESYF